MHTSRQKRTTAEREPFYTHAVAVVALIRAQFHEITANAITADSMRYCSTSTERTGRPFSSRVIAAQEAPTRQRLRQQLVRPLCFESYLSVVGSSPSSLLLSTAYLLEECVEVLTLVLQVIDLFSPLFLVHRSSLAFGLFHHFHLLG